MPIEQADNDWHRLDRQGLGEALMPLLQVIYPDSADAVCARIITLMNSHASPPSAGRDTRWDQSDILLITYGDSIVDNERPPLHVLNEFLGEYLQDCINDVHILPFFPFSSDDGFAVIDYRKVNPELGDWDDIRLIAQHYRFMSDLVINHVSRESLWFYDYVADVAPARDYFIEMEPDTDVSMVTRPRNTPLLAPVNTRRGMRYVWATFSEDQIDLNFANPDVLLEFIDIMLFYVQQGTQILRLDAIAYLWKTLGTTCIHLEQTHHVVKLLRVILNHVAPMSILITETNVPNAENLSYFGDGDEAHMVYQFTLPPLLLHAMNRGTSVHLTRWVNELPPLPEDCTYLNFTASHDGIGVRALEGILPANEVQNLIDNMHQYGGFVSMKANPQGEDTPYEINISLFDAMQGTGRNVDQWQVSRFLCSQAIMLALQGIPAVYIHSLLATPNDLRGVEISGRTRSINRKKWDLAELRDILANHTTPNHEVFNEMRRLLQIRQQEPCFHPSMPQSAIDAGYALFVLLRTDPASTRRLLAIHNTTVAPQSIVLKELAIAVEGHWYDLLSDYRTEPDTERIDLQPYQFMWLVCGN